MLYKTLKLDKYKMNKSGDGQPIFARMMDHLMGEASKGRLPIKVDSRWCEPVALQAHILNGMHRRGDVEGIQTHIAKMMLAAAMAEE